MFNPKPVVQLIALPGHRPCVVIDDFLLHPQSLADAAVQHRAGFVQAPGNAFPGIEMRMADEVNARLNEFFMLHVRHLLGARRVTEMYSRLSMVTLAPEQLRPLQRLCHHDNGDDIPGISFPASVLYLFKDAALGGTSLYRPKREPAEMARLMDQWARLSGEEFSQVLGAAPAYLNASNEYFELLCTVPPRWNRIVFYDGGIFHNAHITRPELLSDDPTQGRLTLNGFWVCRQAAGA